MNTPFFSIIIPVYNRSWSVGRAVESAISFSKNNIDVEIIIVDDASTDNSVEVIKNLIDKNLSGTGTSIRLIRHITNKGVCGAKNTGGKSASGEWIIFLDSDDELIGNTARAIYGALLDNRNCPLHFFKCIGENESVTSETINKFELRNFSVYLSKGTNGEALPVIFKDVFNEHPYDEDIRGYESLSYLRIVRKYSLVVINSLVVRRYFTSHDDRLSSKEGVRLRQRDMAIGHLRIIKEHSAAMTIPALIKQSLRYFRSLLIFKFKLKI
jgi:glycosyltransferase involved in cell wall biosynthesis